MKDKRTTRTTGGFRTPLPWPSREALKRRATRRQRRLLVALALAVVALAVVVVIVIERSEEAPPTPPVVERLTACDAPPAVSIAYAHFHDQALYRLGDDAADPLPLASGTDWTRYPTWSPDGARISFRYGDMLAVVDADGGPILELMDFPPGAGWWAWSPDGRYLAIQGHSEEDPDRWTLYTVEVDTATITTIADHSHPDPIWWNWSPAGHQLVIATYREEGSTVETMQADGTEPIAIASDVGPSPRPEWTPDGLAVMYFNAAADALEVVQLATGAVERQIPGRWNILSHDERETPWSPDGEYLALRLANDIVALRWTANTTRQLTLSPEDDIFLNWSPDSTRVLFSSPVDGQPGLFTADVASGTTVQLFDALVLDATWSPDGRWVVFGAANMLYIAADDGSDLRQLAEDPGAYQVAWSPDSRYLAFRGDPGGIHIMELSSEQACLLGERITDFAWRPTANAN